MKLKEIDKKIVEIEKEVAKKEQEMDDLKVSLIIRKAIGSKLKKDFMKSYTTTNQMKSLTN